jgi:hypothetical protein
MSMISSPPSDRDFLYWVVRSRKRGIGLIVGSIYFVVAVFETKLLSGVWDSVVKKASVTSFPNWLPNLLQCMALLPLPIACYLVKPPRWLTDKYKPVGLACNQFRDSLTMLVATWIGFYFLVFLRQAQTIDFRWDPWIDLLNNLQGVFLFVCYWIMTAKTRVSDESQLEQGQDGQSRYLWPVYCVLLWSVLLFLIADVSASPRADGPSTVRTCFQLLSGLWVGVSMALLVGCLGGQYLGHPRKVTLLLYLYAALQLAYVGFNVPSAAVQGTSANSVARTGSGTYFLEEFTTVTSLPLKLLLIGYWYWVLQNGLLAFFLKKTRDDIDFVPSQWEAFSNPTESDSELPVTILGQEQLSIRNN